MWCVCVCSPLFSNVYTYEWGRERVARAQGCCIAAPVSISFLMNETKCWLIINNKWTHFVVWSQRIELSNYARMCSLPQFAHDFFLSFVLAPRSWRKACRVRRKIKIFSTVIHVGSYANECLLLIHIKNGQLNNGDVTWDFLVLWPNTTWLFIMTTKATRIF